MVQLLAPYSNSMRLGQGFNSYAQQICLDRAVHPDPETEKGRMHRRKEKAEILSDPDDEEASSLEGLPGGDKPKMETAVNSPILPHARHRFLPLPSLL